MAAALDGTSFTVGLNLLDGLVHSVALYLLDWDNNGRSEQINVVSAATGANLATQTVSNFGGGVYVVFSVRGNVQFQFTKIAGFNAVLSGIFLGGEPPAASSLATDILTQGNWKGVYGADGYNVLGDSASYPTYASVRPIGASSFVWASTSTNRNALQRASTSGQVAATWYNTFGNTFTVDVNLLDGQNHEVALYLLDWDNEGRSEQINVLNAETGAVLSSQTVANFQGGKYLVFSVQGAVEFQFTKITGFNAVLSGLFFGGATPATAFVAGNTTTKGSWQGTYGGDGYNVAGGSVSIPAYAHVSIAGETFFTWAASTTDPRSYAGRRQQPGGSHVV